MAGIYIDINIAESVEVIIWQCGLINNICNNAEHNAITMVTTPAVMTHFHRFMIAMGH